MLVNNIKVMSDILIPEEIIGMDHPLYNRGKIPDVLWVIPAGILNIVVLLYLNNTKSEDGC